MFHNESSTSKRQILELHYLSLALTLSTRNWPTFCNSKWRPKGAKSQVGQISLCIPLPLNFFRQTPWGLSAAPICQAFIPINLHDKSKPEFVKNPNKLIDAYLLHSHNEWNIVSSLANYLSGSTSRNIPLIRPILNLFLTTTLNAHNYNEIRHP